MMPLETRQVFLSMHGDPAGIVFLPRWVKMTNDPLERFAAQVLGEPFPSLRLAQRRDCGPFRRAMASGKATGKPASWHDTSDIG
jgi:hypothetical protein